MRKHIYNVIGAKYSNLAIVPGGDNNVDCSTRGFRAHRYHAVFKGHATTLRKYSSGQTLHRLLLPLILRCGP